VADDDLISRLREQHDWSLRTPCSETPPHDSPDLLAEAANALEDQAAEIARHHADFVRWEEMAAKGAAATARLAEVEADRDRIVAYLRERDGKMLHGGRVLYDLDLGPEETT